MGLARCEILTDDESSDALLMGGSEEGRAELPFWTLTPAELKEDVRVMALEDDRRVHQRKRGMSWSLRLKRTFWTAVDAQEQVFMRFDFCEQAHKSDHEWCDGRRELAGFAAVSL